MSFSTKNVLFTEIGPYLASNSSFENGQFEYLGINVNWMLYCTKETAFYAAQRLDQQPKVDILNRSAKLALFIACSCLDKKAKQKMIDSLKKHSKKMPSSSQHNIEVWNSFSPDFIIPNISITPSPYIFDSKCVEIAVVHDFVGCMRFCKEEVSGALQLLDQNKIPPIQTAIHHVHYTYMFLTDPNCWNHYANNLFYAS